MMEPSIHTNNTVLKVRGELLRSAVVLHCSLCSDRGVSFDELRRDVFNRVGRICRQASHLDFIKSRKRFTIIGEEVIDLVSGVLQVELVYQQHQPCYFMQRRPLHIPVQVVSKGPVQ